VAFFDVFSPLQTGVQTGCRSILPPGTEGKVTNMIDEEKVFPRFLPKDSKPYGEIMTKDFLDMKLCFVYEGSENWRTTSFLTKSSGYTEDEIFSIALDNAIKRYPADILHPSDVLGLPDPECAPPIYLAKAKGIGETDFGAIVMLYKEVLRKFAEDGGGFYIIPSSVHEVLFVPRETGIDEDDMLSMIQQVNEDVVAPCDILSDSLYYYDDESEMIRIVK